MSRVRALLYDPRFDYEPGNVVFMRHPVYGESLARVEQRIEASGLAKIEFQFFDRDFDARWKADRHTKFFAANIGGQSLRPSHIYITTTRECINQKARAHPGGEGQAHPQGDYQKLVLSIVRGGASITITDLKAAVQEELSLTQADWAARPNHPGKVVWLERLHGALHNLTRRGILVIPSRGIYRRAKHS